MITDKHTIRKQILERRSALTCEILDLAGKTAAEKLALTEEFRKAKTVMLYMDFRNEVPTGNIIDMIRSSDKVLILPYTNSAFMIIPYEIPNTGSLKDYLFQSGFGISEPDPALCREADPMSIDLIVIPGSVFDINNNRIGYGKGCYDRFLPKLHGSACKIALTYDFQVLPSVPAGPADVKMDKILIINTTRLE